MVCAAGKGWCTWQLCSVVAVVLGLYEDSTLLLNRMWACVCVWSMHGELSAVVQLVFVCFSNGSVGVSFTHFSHVYHKVRLKYRQIFPCSDDGNNPAAYSLQVHGYRLYFKCRNPPWNSAIQFKYMITPSYLCSASARTANTSAQRCLTGSNECLIWSCYGAWRHLDSTAVAHRVRTQRSASAAATENNCEFVLLEFNVSIFINVVHKIS